MVRSIAMNRRATCAAVLIAATAFTLGCGDSGETPDLDSAPPLDTGAETEVSGPLDAADATPLADVDGGETGPKIGATTPFVSFEAEDGKVGGGAAIRRLTSAPTTPYSSPELEASGHAYVSLTAVGDYVEWTNDTGRALTAIDIRASIPDSPGGGGTSATLGLYVDGMLRQQVNLSSRQTWLYENDGNYNGNDQDPTHGSPRVFYDDVHLFIAGAPLGPSSRIRLQKDGSNVAAFYHVDVVDLETPKPATAKPTDGLSILDYGARANDPSFDSTKAIQACIDDAQKMKKSVFIPPGTFYLLTTSGLHAKGITLRGAGAWYSTIYRRVPLPNPSPLGALFELDSCHVSDLALDSNATSRATIDGAGGAMDTTGTGWTADGIWTQHTLSGFWASGISGLVENCRLLGIWADGCNLNNVSLTGTVGNDLTARNNFVRGTGDDAMAINSVDFNGTQHYTPMSHAVFENNTTIAAWGGKGLAIYGGSDHVVRYNYTSDTARYIGLGVGKFGVNGSELRSATVTDNVVVRCGGNAYSQGQPALHIGNGGDGKEVGSVAGAIIAHNLVRDALYDAVGFSTSTAIVFDGNTMTSPGRDGVVISPPFYPAPTGSATLTGNVVTGVAAGHLAFRNASSGYVVSGGGNSW